MMKQFQIAIDSMCVAAILSAGAPVLAEEAPDTSGVQLAMEYLLSQDASDNVKVSFRMDGTAEIRPRAHGLHRDQPGERARGPYRLDPHTTIAARLER